MGSILYFEGNLELSDRLFLHPEEIQQSVERVLDLPHIQMSQADRIVLIDTLKCVSFGVYSFVHVHM